MGSHFKLNSLAALNAPITDHCLATIYFYTIYVLWIDWTPPLHSISSRWMAILVWYDHNIVCTIFYYEESNWVKEHVRLCFVIEYLFYGHLTDNQFSVCPQFIGRQSRQSIFMHLWCDCESIGQKRQHDSSKYNTRRPIAIFLSNRKLSIAHECYVQQKCFHVFRSQHRTEIQTLW